MSLPYSYESSLRAHDIAIFEWLGKLRVDYAGIGTGSGSGPGYPPVSPLGRPILRVRASPDRAFASTVDLLTSQGYLTQESAQKTREAAGDMSVLPLPICTFQRGDPQIDPELSSAVKRPRTEYDAVNRRYVVHPWPGHYKTDYAITFWTHKNYTDDFIREWIYGQLGQRGAGNFETFIPVQHAPPWGVFYQSLKLLDSADQSQLEGAEPRYKRFTFNFALRTWIMKLSLPLEDPVQVTKIKTYTFPASYDQQRASVHRLQPDAFSPPANPPQTDNLFAFDVLPLSRYADLWPKTGEAIVAPGGMAPQAQPRSGQPHFPT